MSATESVTPRLYTETLAASRPESRATSTHLFQSMSAAIEVVADFLTCAAGIFAAYLLDPSLYIGRQIPISPARSRGCEFRYLFICGASSTPERSISREQRPASDSGNGTRNSHPCSVRAGHASIQSSAET